MNGCGAVSNCFLCTRPEGHQGDHTAMFGSKAQATWPVTDRERAERLYRRASQACAHHYARENSPCAGCTVQALEEAIRFGRGTLSPSMEAP